MLILSTIIPDEGIQTKMKDAFPELNFIYQEGWMDERLSEAEILITYGEDLTEKIIGKAANLKWIMVMSAGMELMPFKAIEERGILVTNAKGIHKIPMAEYTIGMLLQYEKKLKLLMKNEREEMWDRKIEVGELNGKTMLVLGAGAIGGEVARLGKAFRMTTLGVNRSGKPVESIDRLYTLDNLLEAIPGADYIVSVLPSTDETKDLLQKEHFKAMKESAVFVNIGRGDLIDEEVLIEALEAGELAHAILDVFDPEPLEKGHPFWRMENVTVTPHLSSKSGEYLPRTFAIFEKNMREYLKSGKDFINVIDLSRGY
ncbi:D-2-hydroxyacid dehydrogenase [Peribacillus simplex]|uniref:D-2-hydroxyacid dehydrogenase n=1 Tax=Peribacillus TaxID=2675229 RepID=UPI00295577C6|nr:MULTISPECIES: D-2-hydroxyacid dehydrogenase [Peribacillus]MDV7765673.1 D-2-hydroxyacid dehydrogenase [Peribacillus sp. CSMR9]MDW7616020.1 D-2-hydroxyacid dehydrogenase [Peribacillus simplex]